ncbi:MAG: DUF4333 domain-containing protein [Actinomycetia bacterium]|nr:DUF4333 domain-containing protein [Actinomycetes bacterium]
MRITAAAGAALAMAGLLGAGLTGCSTTTSLSAADLQTRLADQQTEAGDPPQSVTCNGDLIGEVGKTTVCDVVFSDTNSVEATVTATGVDGSDVSFDVSPSVTKEQLETGVSGNDDAQAVTCDSGLEGTVGSSANCEVTVGGVTAKQVIVVENVNGLEIDVEMFPVVAKEKVQEVLLQKLNADGSPAETVECVDDIVARPGTYGECVAVTGDQKQGYDVTVTTVDGDNVDIEYQNSP